MTTPNPVFTVFKSLLVQSHLNNNPSLSSTALEDIRNKIESEVHLSTPLSSIGLDSMTMTWVLVTFEEKLNIRTDSISFFELYDVNDLVREVSAQVVQKPIAAIHA